MSSLRLSAAALGLLAAACASSSPTTTGQGPAAAGFNAPLRLTGTEPFWGGRIGAETITLTGAERPDINLPSVQPAISGDSARWQTPPAGSAGSPSIVVVTAAQPGATEEAMAQNVVRVVENALYRIEGVHRVGAATSAGRSIMTVGFMPGRSPEAAAAAVRAAISGVRLPARAQATVTFSRAQPLDIVLTRETCSDGMSDRRYPFAATVQFAGETLRGCAIPEADWGGER